LAASSAVYTRQQFLLLCQVGMLITTNGILSRRLDYIYNHHQDQDYLYHHQIFLS
jgi:hypothetical protein